MFDRIIIGAGIYGLYAALKSVEKGYNTLVIERDNEIFSRGSFINQARLHSGYHYPRSKETAQKSRDYFFRFMNDFSEAINKDFKQLYAISHEKSLTTKEDFINFCDDLNIKCDEIDSSIYFKPDMVDGLFDTLEYSIDCKKVGEILLNKCLKYSNFSIKLNSEVVNIIRLDGIYHVFTNNEHEYLAPWLLNATYASTNQILQMLNIPLLDIKYEQCEVTLCKVSDNIKNIGITVMDGPFFSVMPFGFSGYHSITSVCHTPHITSYDKTPTYECQLKHEKCNASSLSNCNECQLMTSEVDKMISLAKKYLNDDITIDPVKPIYVIKPILNSCEKDDARPTLVKSYDTMPNFFTVFSGKLNTIYDLDIIL